MIDAKDNIFFRFIKLILFIVNISLYGLGIYHNLKEFKYNYEADIFELKYLIYAYIFILLTASIVFIFIKKVKYSISILMIYFIFLICITFAITSKIHGDADHYYIVTGKIKTDINLKNDTVIIQPADIGDLIFKTYSDHYYNWKCREKINKINEIINDYSDSSYFSNYMLPLFCRLTGSEYKVYGSYFCNTEINIRAIKHIKEFPIKIYKNNNILLDTTFMRDVVKIDDSLKITIIKLPEIKIIDK